MGVEVYHPSNRSGSGFAALDAMARRMGLLVTGGSDYHQDNDKHGAIGCTCQAWTTCGEDVDKLQVMLYNEASRAAEELSAPLS